MGDVKLFAAAGAWVKLDGLPSVLLIGSLLGLVYALFVLRRAPTDAALLKVPLGAGLCAGFWLTWTYGPVFDWTLDAILGAWDQLMNVMKAGTGVKRAITDEARFLSGLVDGGLLAASDVNRLARTQAETGETLCRLIPKLGLLEEKVLAEQAALFLKLRLFDKEALPSEPLLPEQLSETFLMAEGLLPVQLQDGRLISRDLRPVFRL